MKAITLIALFTPMGIVDNLAIQVVLVAFVLVTLPFVNFEETT